MRRGNLFRVLRSEEQKEVTKNYGSRQNFHGEITLESGKQGYNIKFNDLPADYQAVHARRRNTTSVAEEGEEEEECDYLSADLMIESSANRMEADQ